MRTLLSGVTTPTAILVPPTSTPMAFIASPPCYAPAQAGAPSFSGVPRLQEICGPARFAPFSEESNSPHRSMKTNFSCREMEHLRPLVDRQDSSSATSEVGRAVRARGRPPPRLQGTARTRCRSPELRTRSVYEQTEHVPRTDYSRRRAAQGWSGVDPLDVRSRYAFGSGHEAGERRRAP